VRTESVEFHPEASAEYDAAFDWYLERSPDAALEFDAEVDRALAQIVEGASTLGCWSFLYSQIPSAATPLHPDLSRTNDWRYSSGCGCAHEPKAGILERVVVVVVPTLRKPRKVGWPAQVARASDQSRKPNVD
jgi:hypothetical protein